MNCWKSSGFSLIPALFFVDFTAGDVSQRFMYSIIKYQEEHEFLNIVRPCLNKETNPNPKQTSKQTKSTPNFMLTYCVPAKYYYCQHYGQKSLPTADVRPLIFQFSHIFDNIEHLWKVHQQLTKK